MAEHLGAEMASSARTTFRRWAMLFAALATILLALSTWIYFPHILFLYFTYFSKETKHYTVEDRPISLAEVPADWVTVDLGEVEFRLPNQFQPYRHRSGAISAIATGGPSRIYSAGRSFISLDSSPTYFQLFDIGPARIRFLPDKTSLTFPEIRLACNQLTVNTFHFSMSSKEVMWLQILFAIKNTSIHDEGDHSESFFFNNIHGCVTYSANGHMAFVEWQKDGSTLGGDFLLDFRDRPINKELVRSLCSSLKIKARP